MNPPSIKEYLVKINIDTAPLVSFVKENPLAALGALAATGATVLNGYAKATNARAASRNSKSWQRETKRRENIKK